jgi:hypothetical protein
MTGIVRMAIFDILDMHLPKLITSPRSRYESMIVNTRVRGIDMVKKTGPFFSITHTCM